MSRRLRLDFWSGVMAVALAVVALLMVWPLFNIFTASVIDNRSGALTLANFARILGHPAYRGALINSLIVGAGGMLGAMLLGIPLAVLTTRFVIAGRDLLATLPREEGVDNDACSEIGQLIVYVAPYPLL